MKMVLLGIIISLFLIASAIAWNILMAGQPIHPEEIPEWTLREITASHWRLHAKHDPKRQTDAWNAGPNPPQTCDTLIIVAGVEEGEEFLQIGAEASRHANTILMRQPLRDFVHEVNFDEWGVREWWSFPVLVRIEFLHNLGALKTILMRISTEGKTDERFTEKVVLAGGSLGAPYPVILTSFYPEMVDGLMIVYAFTNFSHLIHSELWRQGLIHFRLSETDSGFIPVLKRFGLNTIARILSLLLGNMLKYGQIELYLSDIHDTPIHFINGKSDYLVSEKTYLPMWQTAPEPKTEQWVEGDHINPGEPQQVKRVMRMMDEWGRKMKIRNCE